MSEHRRTVSRRSVLAGGLLTASAWGLGGLSGLSVPAFGQPAGRAIADPFTLGVASGDPLPDGVVLWTRLAPEPLNDDGMGGMPDRVFDVEWELATDERFRRVERSGVAQAAPEQGHSVHVEPGGLRPGAEYFYRFRVDGHISPVGRTRTAPAPQTMGPALTMCFASCSHFGHGYFTAYRRLAEDEPGLVLHLGDYQYEYPAGADEVREIVGPETVSLANYRQRHAQYKTDPDLQLAHAVAPWLVVFDDHEVENNWADEVPEQADPNFLERRRVALQAYYENMPLRATARPNGIDMRLFRRTQWGGLATFHMLDTRQYRDDQACGDGAKDCPERHNPARTITGAEQQDWLLDGFRQSTARWDVLGQQVFFAERDFTAGDGETNSMDAWDGYVANRDRVVAGWTDAGVRNAVVLTGDVHRHYAAEIKRDYDDDAAAPVGVELVATSISTNRDGGEDTNDGLLNENPHVKYYKNRRGYVRTRFTGSEMTVDFRTLPYVTRPGAPAETAATFVVEDRNPRLNPA